MNKLLLASIIAVIVAYIGIAIKMRYKRRLTFLRDYKKALEEIRGDINYYKSDLSDIIDRIMETKSKDFKCVLSNYKHCIISNCNVEIKTNYIKSRDREIIQNCFNNIGRMDANSEIGALDKAIIEADNMVMIASSDYQNRGELYSKLGILLALALLILLV